MPMISARDAGGWSREFEARWKITQAVDGAGLTPMQTVHLLATMLAEYTKRLEANECRE